tara:strand:+ start:891 stop:1295 length:405 start_codon:yes stop_codon:yes gene_type:complete
MGLKISLVLGVFLISSLTASGIYIKNLNNQISTLKANQIILDSKIKEQNESIKNYLAKQKENLEQINSLEKDKQEATRAVTELRNKFARHNLNNLALMKPGLIENRVNKGSKKVFDELMSLTTPLVKDESSPRN